MGLVHAAWRQRSVSYTGTGDSAGIPNRKVNDVHSNGTAHTPANNGHPGGYHSGNHTLEGRSPSGGTVGLEPVASYLETSDGGWH